MKNKHDTVAGMLHKRWYRYCVDIIEVSEGASESAKKEMVQPLRCLGDQKTTSKYWRDYWRNAIDDDWWSEQQLNLSQSSHAGAGTELGKNAKVQDSKDVVHGKRGNVEIKRNEECIEILEKNKIEEQKDDMIETVQVIPDDSQQKESDNDEEDEDDEKDIYEENYHDDDIEVENSVIVNEIDDKAGNAQELACSIGLLPKNTVDRFVYVTPALQCQLWDPGGHVEYCA